MKLVPRAIINIQNAKLKHAESTNNIRPGPAQDIHFFYTRSHLSALQSCALILSTNVQFFSHLNSAIHNLVIELNSSLEAINFF